MHKQPTRAFRTLRSIISRRVTCTPPVPIAGSRFPTAAAAVATPLLHHWHRIRTMASSAAAAKRLEGKTIVITGASSGIGRSTAFEFARTAPQNLKLVLTARRVDTLRQIAADITKEVGDGVKVLPVQLDVSNPEAVRGFVPGLPEEFRDIDVLVNNA